ncbi:carbohydrate kinase family protein [Luteolibacter marinus]|uniref:carbohydrate kinase family protein n=1 Tax=Luteolibacter marinus TaxID=2776705 RepID=UPI001868881A|nr:carbohydrate kinase [Luteolibacter marinus]
MTSSHPNPATSDLPGPAPRIIGIGEVLWDLFPSGACFGGAAANFACQAVRSGARVSLLSGLGRDAAGREARAILGHFGVDTSLLQEVPGHPTGTVRVTLDAEGKPVFTIGEDSAWDHVAWSADLADRLPRTDAIYFGTLSQRSIETRSTIRQALALAAEAGLARVLDVNLRAPYFDRMMIRDSVGLCSVLKLSEEEFPLVLEACGIPAGDPEDSALRHLLEKENLDLVAMTRGADGAVLVSRDETIVQPGIPIRVADTVGAGDAFTAALLTGWLKGRPLREIAATACETAAAACSHAGGIPPYPALTETEPPRTNRCAG